MLSGEVTEYELGRVYFIVSSKHDEATLSIEHHPAQQSLLLPVYPSSAVEESLPLLDRATAHYAAQWEKIMVSDLDRDANGFSVPGDHLPRGIAPIENADELLRIARRHVAGTEEGEASLAEPTARVLSDDAHVWPSNIWEFAHEAEILNEHDITLVTPD